MTDDGMGMEGSLTTPTTRLTTPKCHFFSCRFNLTMLGVLSQVRILSYGLSFLPSLRILADSAVLVSCHTVIQMLTTVTA